MKNWKTSLGGIIMAAGAAMQMSDNQTVHIIGWIIVSVGAAFFGLSAKDNNVTGGKVQQ